MTGLGDDDALMESLTGVFEAFDPVPDSARRFALESRRLLSLESELAEIVADSLVGADGSRSGRRARTLELASAGLVIRLECDDEVAGSIDPFVVGTVVSVQHVDGRSEQLEVSDSGFFLFEAPRTVFRLAVVGDSTSVSTDWIQP